MFLGCLLHSQPARVHTHIFPTTVLYAVYHLPLWPTLFSVLKGLGLDTDKEASGWAVEYVNPVDDITALLSGYQTTTTNFSIPTLSNTRVITGQSKALAMEDCLG